MSLPGVPARFVWLGRYWGVNLPNYQMVDCSVRPLVPDKVTCNGVFPGVPPDDPDVQGLWCNVIVPPEMLNEAGDAIDVAQLGDLYPTAPKVAAASVDPGLAPAP